MEKVVRVCDLHPDEVAASSSVSVVIGGSTRRLDVCEAHFRALEGLPQHDELSSQPASGLSRAKRAAASTQPPNVAGSGTDRSGLEREDHAAAPASRRPGSRRSLQQERAAVRAWARDRGLDVRDRGRLPSGLLDDYRQAN